jgi:hypothetical protein
MNKEEFDKKKKRLMDKITNPVERHRICLYCNEPFFANKTDKYFCSDNCYSMNYNENVRPVKELKKLYKDIDMQRQERESLINSLKTHENILRRNIEIIDYLNIDMLDGTNYPKVLLTNLGIDFRIFDDKKIVPDTLDAYELIMGHYRLTLLDDNVIHIKNNIQP